MKYEPEFVRGYRSGKRVVSDGAERLSGNRWKLAQGEVVVPPATRARLSYLRGRGAWGMRIRREDQIPDLRDWSTWLAAEADLSEDAQDLLARTRKFLAARDQRSALEAALAPRGEA